MKLSVVRGGGLAGIVTRTELSTDALPPETARTLREGVERSGLLDMPQPAPPTEPSPDALQYEITVEDEATTRSLQLSDENLPDSIRSLLSWVDSIPEKDEWLEQPGGGRRL